MTVKTLFVRAGPTWIIRAIAFPKPPELPDPCPTLAFLKEQMEANAADVAKMTSLLTRAARDGVTNQEKFKLLPGSDDIWEFRAGALRILCFRDDGALILCTHGFVKKSQKAPVSEIERAERYRTQYFAAKTHKHLIHGPRPKTKQ